MDPWNGSGTSTAAAALHGYRAYGFDINPVMAVVAKARLLPKLELPSMTPLLAEINRKASDCKHSCLDQDPLLTWFVPDAAAAIREIDRTIHALLVSADSVASSAESASSMSTIAAFFYVALFRAVRHLLARFRPSNPTWITRPTSPRSRIRPSGVDIRSSFTLEVTEMSTALIAESNEWDLIGTDCTINVASSESLPLPENAIDLVLSSPPYCTRIDYGVATSPELAVLGFPITDQLRQLRGTLIGTPTIQRKLPSPEANWGYSCNAFLDRVAHHPSKAAKSYYYKTYVQYFAAIARSLSEVGRCLKPGGRCVLVVQDSYFKDIRADLAVIFKEMACGNQLALSRQVDFPMARTLVNINTKSRQYRLSSSAIESVLCFIKN